MQRVDIYNRAMEFFLFFPSSFFLKISKIRSNLIHPRTTTALIEFSGEKFYLYETKQKKKKKIIRTIFSFNFFKLHGTIFLK